MSLQALLHVFLLQFGQYQFADFAFAKSVNRFEKYGFYSPNFVLSCKYTVSDYSVCCLITNSQNIYDAKLTLYSRVRDYSEKPTAEERSEDLQRKARPLW